MSDQEKEKVEDLDEEVTATVDAQDLKSILSGSMFFSRFKGYMFTFLAIIIALGEYSEAVSLIGDGFDSVRSKFTHDIEYEQLGLIHVGNTVSYVEGVLGTPQVARSISEDLTANYFYNDKYLVTLFYNDDRVDAYTIISLVDDFNPSVFRDSKLKWLLGKETYSTFPTTPQVYIIDHSKTASYYIERLEKGRAGLFANSYLGNMPFGSAIDHTLIADLYELEVHGGEKEIMSAQEMLRNNLYPNFYGEGALEMEQIEKSLLTGAEFQSYFGR